MCHFLPFYLHLNDHLMHIIIKINIREKLEYDIYYRNLVLNNNYFDTKMRYYLILLVVSSLHSDTNDLIVPCIRMRESDVLKALIKVLSEL